jgi:tetratricopeptide (TPR) repeat protein
LKRELKREIKQDEFTTWMETIITWAEGHRDEVRIGLGVTVVLLAAFGALAYFQSHRSREAQRAYQEALTAFEAPVATELPPGADRPAGQVFATAEDKYKTAAAAFEGVARRHGSSDLARRARYYAAVCRMELGQYDDAEKSLRELQTGGKNDLVPDLARMTLAGLYRRIGETDQAVEIYRGIVSSPDTNVPRDEALQSLAATLDEAGRYGEARATYRELVEHFPASVYAPGARARADYLETAEQVS